MNRNTNKILVAIRGIWNILERNKELARRIGISEMQEHDND